MLANWFPTLVVLVEIFVSFVMCVSFDWDEVGMFGNLFFEFGRYIFSFNRAFFWAWNTCISLSMWKKNIYNLVL